MDESVKTSIQRPREKTYEHGVTEGTAKSYLTYEAYKFSRGSIYCSEDMVELASCHSGFVHSGAPLSHTGTAGGKVE